jgi:hypothetical protein
MKKLTAVLSILTGAAALVAGSVLPASANIVTFTFNIDQCGNGGCGSPPYGIITVTDVCGGVTVDVDLNNGVGFVSTGGGVLNNDQLYFDLSPSVPVGNITNLPSLWTAGVGSFSTNGGNGTFNTKLDCNASCAPGGSNPYFPEFTFNISGVTSASFISPADSSDSAYFVADLSVNGLTGRVAATKTTTTNRVPEPMTLSLFGAALAGAVVIRRRNKKRNPK